jgi:transposase
MTGTVRGQYTLEFKQEAVRLVRGGQATFSVARTLGISGQTLHNWVKAEAAGRLREIVGKTVSAEQMEIARLKAELAKARIERDILKNQRGTKPPVGIETVALSCLRKGAAVSFLVAIDPVKKHGPWVVANLRVATSSGDPV